MESDTLQTTTTESHEQKQCAKDDALDSGKAPAMTMVVDLRHSSSPRSKMESGIPVSST